MSCFAGTIRIFIYKFYGVKNKFQQVIHVIKNLILTVEIYHVKTRKNLLLSTNSLNLQLDHS